MELAACKAGEGDKFFLLGPYLSNRLTATQIWKSDTSFEIPIESLNIKNVCSKLKLCC